MPWSLKIVTNSLRVVVHVGVKAQLHFEVVEEWEAGEAAVLADGGTYSTCSGTITYRNFRIVIPSRLPTIR